MTNAKWMMLIVLSTTIACSGAADPDENNDNVVINAEPNNDSNQMNNEIPDDVDYTGLFINEVAASGDPNDWFELYNSSDAAIELTGVTLSDDPADPTQAMFESGTVIEAGAFVMFEAADETFGFKLGGDEEFHIYDPSGAEIDGVDWEEGDSPDFKSFGRIPDGTGEFMTLNTPTPGAANVENDADAPVCGDGVIEGTEVCDGTEFGAATCEGEGFAGGGTLTCAPGCDGFETTACVPGASGGVVINEVTSSGDDNIELYNSGDTAVVLDGWYVADSGWDPAAPDEGQRYIFGAGTEIAPGAFLVLVKDTDHMFGVGGDDTITLYDADGMVIDQTTWPDGDADTSWCRATDGDGEFQVCDMATFGASNG